MDCRSGCGRLLYCAFNFVADTRNAEWQADEYPMRAAFGR
ncbi:Uncharacterised protein [Salmonella enterica subsp. arizonae]|uniref:Uncharacterized protein n=1 Tax=Salmonella enterica subsp. arizonae TaxID=59203 RepID=A0A447R1Y1_SALER|nr:Uncharacterised protein [Salmonella enterica subsp. arizonae]